MSITRKYECSKIVNLGAYSHYMGPISKPPGLSMNVYIFLQEGAEKNLEQKFFLGKFYFGKRTFQKSLIRPVIINVHQYYFLEKNTKKARWLP